MAWVAKAGLLSSRLLLLRLRGLGVRRRDGAIAVLAQLWGAREGIGGYWRSGAPVACAPRLPTVGSLHMLALLVGLRRRILEGVGRIWHCDGGGRLGDWRKYLSHRELVAGRLSRLVCLVRGRLAGAGACRRCGLDSVAVPRQGRRWSVIASVAKQSSAGPECPGIASLRPQ